MTKITIPYRNNEVAQDTLDIFIDALCKQFPGTLRIRKALIVETENPEIAGILSLMGSPEVTAEPVPTSETPAPAAKPKIGRPRKVREPKAPANTNSNGHQPDDQAPERTEAHQMALAAAAKLRGRKLG